MVHKISFVQPTHPGLVFLEYETKLSSGENQSGLKLDLNNQPSHKADFILLSSDMGYKFYDPNVFDP